MVGKQVRLDADQPPKLHRSPIGSGQFVDDRESDRVAERAMTGCSGSHGFRGHPATILTPRWLTQFGTSDRAQVWQQRHRGDVPVAPTAVRPTIELVRCIRWPTTAIVLFALLAACGGADSASPSVSDVAEVSEPTTATSTNPTTTPTTTPETTATTPTPETSATPGATDGDVLVASGGLDDTHLTVGDQQFSDAPARDQVWACRQQTDGGGASSQGPWFNGDGTWDLTTKISVQGDVRWDEATVSIEIDGDQRVISSNGLPMEGTGVFPVAADDPAAAYDRNPNSISAQSLSFSVPIAPAVAAAPSCIGGEVGVAVNGVPIFNAFDAGGRDAGAWEVQDVCQGHPQNTGSYHYHTISDCLDPPGENPSRLIGYAFDGFGIYGSRDAQGVEVQNSDLDECHGITSTVEWDGAMVEMYHYVATNEFPYTVGCFRGTSAVNGPVG